MTRAVTEIATLKDSSPEAASAKLAEMTAAYRGQQSTAAADKLAGMLRDPGFHIERGGEHGGSGGIALPGGPAFDSVQTAVAEYHAERGSAIELAMSGATFDVNPSDYLQQKQTVDVLRGMGIGDDVIRQQLSGQPVSRAEFDSVTQWKSAALKDEKWRTAYLKGDPECVRQMTAAHVVLGSPIKEDAA